MAAYRTYSMCSLMYWMSLMLLSWFGTDAYGLLLPNAISSNMVLQRSPQAAVVWGETAANGVVSATLDNMAPIKVFADGAGQFQIRLPPQPSGSGHNLVLSDGEDTIALTNIAFGDVYLCSGQSNMEFSVGDSFDAQSAIQDSDNYPALRLFSIEKKASLTVLTNTTNRWQDGARWVVSSAKYVGGPSFSYFSAVCFYFARELYKAINTNVTEAIPIGVVDVCWGGTRIEAWTTQEGLQKCNANTFSYVEPFSSSVDHLAYSPSEFLPPSLAQSGSHGRHTNMAKSSQFKSLMTKMQSSSAMINADPDPQTASVLFNGMIAPITPMRIRGVTWYQGEANSGNPLGYACLFPAMINDWRNVFGYHMFFSFALLAAYKEGGSQWPPIRDAQLAALNLPYVHVASAQDLGDEQSPQGAIHPRNKTIVGSRMAAGALSIVYGHHVVARGPSASEIIWPLESSSTQSVILRFSATNPENAGLSLKDTSKCDLCCASTQGSAFTVTTSDGKTLRAKAVVDADAYLVIVTVNNLQPNVRVTAIQHGYEAYQQCALYSSSGWPHLPINVSRS